MSTLAMHVNFLVSHGPPPPVTCTKLRNKAVQRVHDCTCVTANRAYLRVAHDIHLVLRHCTDEAKLD